MIWKKKDAAKTIVDVILRNTGYSDISQLFDTNKEYHIQYLKEAAEMIKKAIAKKIPIVIVGDYDADGVTASSIMKQTIEALGGIVKVRLPKRLSEGYGLSTKIVDEIESGLLITVDNGIVAFDAIKKAKEKGLTVIVTDHHELAPDGSIPCADIVIDPHIPSTADFEHYCGAGIAYRLAQELITNEKLIKKLSCLAAIGTIADVVPLIEENRKIVIEGLRNMVTYGYRSSGLYSLLKLYDLDRQIDENDVGFKIGPSINAAGRLEDDGAMKPMNILTYDGPFEENYAKELVELNDERKQMIKEAMERAETNIAENALFSDYPLVISDEFHEGIVGIIAGKLAESRKVPTFVLTKSMETGILKGSGRSANDVHLKDLLDELNENDPSILAKYGGHAEAAGLSVYEDKIDDFSDKIQIPAPSLSEEVVEYDLEIDAADIEKTFNELEKYKPYGNKNERIRFKINNFKLSPRQSSYYATNGDNNENVKLYGVNVTAIGFGMTKQYIDLGEPKEVEIVGTIAKTHFYGKNAIQVEIIDFKPAETKVATSRFSAAIAKAKAERYKS